VADGKFTKQALTMSKRYVD